jgi:anti-sigma factor RsiW
MNWSGCSRLGEVRQTLAQGHWPHACAAELRDHVTQCSDCADEVLITTHLQRARSQAVAAVRPSSSNLLWLKAQARRRTAALEQIERPLVAAQTFAFAVILATITGLIAAHWHGLTDRASMLTAALAGWGMAPILLGIGSLATLGCLAVVYLRDEKQ